MNLTQEEWEELVSLKNAINYSPSTVVPHKMERFTELFVRSIEGRGNNTILTSPTNY
jgi:hypothetical protein